MKRVISVLLLLAATGLANAQSHGYLPTGEFPKTDFSITSIDFNSILSGGPPRDGIPAIDRPKFVSIDMAREWLGPNEPVVAYVNGEDARAYPLQILIYHEIVNDTVGEKPVTVTFCPLCNASIVFDREVAGEILDFGTTGRLRNSDLIMYDRQSESWWQQFTGRGIIGQYNEIKLTQLPSQIVSFDTFAQSFPKGKILGKETGYLRPYGNNPYSGYDDINNSPFLYKGPEDKRLPPMERILAITSENADSLLIPVSPLQNKPVLNIEFNEQSVVIVATTSAQSALDKSKIDESRLIPAAAAFAAHIDNKPLTFEWQNGKLVDKESGSSWNVFGKALDGPHKDKTLTQIDNGVHFAFAWLAFEPDSVIHEFSNK